MLKRALGPRFNECERGRYPFADKRADVQPTHDARRFFKRACMNHDAAVAVLSTAA